MPARRAPRPFEPADTDEVALLWHGSWHEAHGHILPRTVTVHRTPEAFASRLAGFGADAYLIDDEIGPVAFAAIDGGEIDQLYVAARGRGTGVAGWMMDFIEAELTARGHGTAQLECIVGNDRARRFYAGRGYRELAVEPRVVWMPTDPPAPPALFPVHLFSKTLMR